MSVTRARDELVRALGAAAEDGDVRSAVVAVLAGLDAIRDALGWRRPGVVQDRQREALGVSRAATVLAEAAELAWPGVTSSTAVGDDGPGAAVVESLSLFPGG